MDGFRPGKIACRMCPHKEKTGATFRLLLAHTGMHAPG